MLRALGSTRRRSTRLQPTALLPPCTCRFAFAASPLAATARNSAPSTPTARLHTSIPRHTRPQLATATGNALDQDPAIAGEAPPLLVQPNKMQMRPYQLDIINAVLDALREGPYTRLGVSAPTGSGKTAVFTSLIHRLPPLVHPKTRRKADKVLIVVGAIQLAKQAVDTVRRAYPELVIELEQGKMKASGMADVTVATYQTLAHNELDRLAKFDPEDYKAVIIDEAHHATAPSYLAILSRFDPRIAAPLRDTFDPALDPVSPSPIAPSPSALTEAELESEDLEPEGASYDNSQHAAFLASSEPMEGEVVPEPPMMATLNEEGEVCVPLLAFTATWHRADGMALGKVFEKIVWHGDWLDMIRGKWLSQLQFTTIKLGEALDMSSVKVSSSSRDYVMASLAKAVDKTEVNKRAVEAWLEKASGRRSTLVFCVSIAHIISLANAFRAEGIDARFVHEGIKVHERERLYEAFKRGEFPVLINCGILTEGADFPCIDCVLLARPTQSKNLFLQMIGRGLRLSPETGKESCLVIDLVGNSTKGVVCTPTLFGIDPETALEGKTQQELELIAEEQQEIAAEMTAQQEAQEGKPDTGHLIYTDYQSIFDMVPGREGEEKLAPLHIKRLSPLAWVGTGTGVFVLELMSLGYVRVARNADDTEWDAHFYRRLPGGQPPYAKPKHLHSSPSLTQLLPRIDAHILSTPALNPEIDLRRTAGWRFTPASEGQASIILKKLAKPLAEEGFEQGSWIDAVWVGGRKGERKEVSELRKGEASDLISRVKHGGMASVRKVEGQVRKEERRVEKVQRKRVQEKEKKEKKIVAASGRKAAGGESRFAKHMKAMSLARRMAKLSEGRSWKPEGE